MRAALYFRISVRRKKSIEIESNDIKCNSNVDSKTSKKRPRIDAFFAVSGCVFFSFAFCGQFERFVLDEDCAEFPLFASKLLLD